MTWKMRGHAIENADGGIRVGSKGGKRGARGRVGRRREGGMCHGMLLSDTDCRVLMLIHSRVVKQTQRANAAKPSSERVCWCASTPDGGKWQRVG
jgi:hypothetical protein